MAGFSIINVKPSNFAARFSDLEEITEITTKISLNSQWYLIS
jgi:hypothetical protein